MKTFHPIINANLFNARDDQWKKIRTITSSTFTSGKMKKMYGLVRKCVEEYVQSLEKLAEDGTTFDAKRMHECLTMDVIARCEFNTQTNAIKEPKNALIENFRKLFQMKTLTFIAAFVLPKALNTLLNVKSNFDSDANEFLIEMTKTIYQQRKQQTLKHDDYLQLLIDSKAEEHDSVDSDSIDKSNENLFQNEGLY